MNVEALRFKVITHMTDTQAIQLAKNFLKFNSQKQLPPSPSKKQKIPATKIVLEEPSSQRKENSIISGEKNAMNQSIILNQTMRDSFVDQFSKTPDIQKLREQYSRIWYEKLALESSMQRLIDENTKKDQIIRNLKKQLSQNMRHTSFGRH